MIWERLKETDRTATTVPHRLSTFLGETDSAKDRGGRWDLLQRSPVRFGYPVGHGVLGHVAEKGETVEDGNSSRPLRIPYLRPALFDRLVPFAVK